MVYRYIYHFYTYYYVQFHLLLHTRWSFKYNVAPEVNVAALVNGAMMFSYESTLEQLITVPKVGRFYVEYNNVYTSLHLNKMQEQHLNTPGATKYCNYTYEYIFIFAAPQSLNPVLASEKEVVVYIGDQFGCNDLRTLK